MTGSAKVASAFCAASVLAVGLAMMHRGERGPAAQVGQLVGTLQRVPGSDAFELRLTNGGPDRAAVLRWRWLYELRLYDGSGTLLSDEERWRAWAKLAGPEEWEFVVLEPGDSLSFRLQAYTQRGPMAVPDTATRAECVCRPGEAAVIAPPDGVGRARAKLVFLGSPARADL